MSPPFPYIRRPSSARSVPCQGLGEGTPWLTGVHHLRGAAGGAGLATRSAGEPPRMELGKLAPGRKPQSRGCCSPLKGPLLPGPLRPQPRGPPLTSEMTTARPHSSLSGTRALVTLPSAARPVPAPPRHLRDSGLPGLQGHLASRMPGFPSGRTSLSTSLKTVKGRRG